MILIYMKTQFDFVLRKFSFLKKYPEKFQPAGEIYVQQILEIVFKKWAVNYNYHISIPEKSRYSCSDYHLIYPGVI